MTQDIRFQGRSLRLIAADIETEWAAIPLVGRKFVVAMRGVASVEDYYGPYSMQSFVREFLAESDAWVTPLAERIKAELRAMLGEDQIVAEQIAECAAYDGDALPWESPLRGH